MRNRVVTLLLLQVLALPLLAMGQASPVLVLKARIPLANVNGRMDHLGVDINSKRLFATAFNNHTVEVIDLEAGRQVHTITDLAEPQGAFYDTSTNRLFVASSMDGTVKIFDGNTFQMVATVKLSTDADNVRYDARSNRVVVGYGGEKFLGGKPVRGQGDGALAFLGRHGEEDRGDRPGCPSRIFSVREDRNTSFRERSGSQGEIEVADVVKGSVLAHWPVTTSHGQFPDDTWTKLIIGCSLDAAPPRACLSSIPRAARRWRPSKQAVRTTSFTTRAKAEFTWDRQRRLH